MTNVNDVINDIDLFYNSYNNENVNDLCEKDKYYHYVKLNNELITILEHLKTINNKNRRILYELSNKNKNIFHSDF